VEVGSEKEVKPTVYRSIGKPEIILNRGEKGTKQVLGIIRQKN